MFYPIIQFSFCINIFLPFFRSTEYVDCGKCECECECECTQHSDINWFIMKT